MAPRTKKKSSEGLKITCINCDRPLLASQKFYTSSGEAYADTGYCNICKECLKKMILENGVLDEENFIDVCDILDIPFIPHEFYALVQKGISNEAFLGDYKKILNIKKEYKGLRFKDSVEYENDVAGIVADTKQQIKKTAAQQVTPELIERWGIGFKPEYYLDVQRRYDKFMEYEDEDKLDYKKESDYRTLCQLERKKTELMQDKDAKMSDIKSVVDTISKLSEDLNIKALQKKQDEASNRHNIIGLVAKYQEDVLKQPIPKLTWEDIKNDMTIQEWRKEQAYFISPLLEELNKPNIFREVVGADMSTYSPTEEELERNFVDLLNDDESSVE